jgi:hypothetical protein
MEDIMSTPRSLAQLLFDAAKAVVNAHNVLETRMRSVFSLVTEAGFKLEVNSSLPNLRDTVDTYAKSGNTDLLEVHTMLQEQVRLRVEGKTEEKRQQASAILDRLQKQWRSLLTYEQGKLRKAQGLAAKTAGQEKREKVAKAVETAAILLAADPATLTVEQIQRKATIQECYALLDAADEQTILAIRAYTFSVLKKREEEVAQVPTEPVKIAKAAKAPAETIAA